MATLPSFLGHSSSYICGLAEDDTDQCDDGDYRDNDDQAGDDDDDAAENFVRV